MFPLAIFMMIAPAQGPARAESIVWAHGIRHRFAWAQGGSAGAVDNTGSFFGGAYFDAYLEGGVFL